MPHEEEVDANQKIKALEAKVRELDNVIANMPGHVYWLDRNNVYMGCNHIQAQAFNIPSRHAIHGKTNAMLLPEIALKLDDINQKVMTGLESSYFGEEHADFDQEYQIFLSQKVALRDDEDNVVGLLGVSFDITDRKRMEKELKEAKDQAEIASQTKTEFIQNMEHDIRTPLSGIMGVISHLGQLEGDLEKKKFIDDLYIATNELISYLDNIVELAQMNSHDTPLTCKEFNVEQILQGIVNIELAAAKAKNLDLVLQCPDEVPRIIMGDRFRLHRLLLNLVNNAIKFTQKGSITLSVELIEEDVYSEEVILKFSVKDTGMGIEEKHHEMIFDKFVRCDASNKGVHKGGGLGLWIVKQFVKDLQGEIELMSELGKGSLFMCTIPFKVL